MGKRKNIDNEGENDRENASRKMETRKKDDGNLLGRTTPIPILLPDDLPVPKWSLFKFDETKQNVIDLKNGSDSTKKALLRSAQLFENFLSEKKVFFFLFLLNIFINFFLTEIKY